MFTLFRSTDDEDRETLIHDLAKVVAQRTRTNLTPMAADMSVAELRGYVRSRAARDARDQVRSSLAQVRLPQDQEGDLTADVLERAVHLVIRDLLVSPVVAIPTPHVQTRAA